MVICERRHLRLSETRTHSPARRQVANCESDTAQLPAAGATAIAQSRSAASVAARTAPSRQARINYEAPPPVASNRTAG
eukprot:222429-Chlamydomonas_euryale.AAC.6